MKAMIKFIDGDIFEANAEALVNPVNCLGVTGAGLAKKFRKKFPRAFANYDNACKRHVLSPGGVIVDPSGVEAGNPRFIFHLATKGDWRKPSDYYFIYICVFNLKWMADFYSIKTLAIPAIGCGLGGLDWEKVKPMLIERFEHSDLDVSVYLP